MVAGLRKDLNAAIMAVVKSNALKFLGALENQDSISYCT